MDLPVVLFFSDMATNVAEKDEQAAATTINHTRFHSTGRSPSSVAVLH